MYYSLAWVVQLFKQTQIHNAKKQNHDHLIASANYEAY